MKLDSKRTTIFLAAASVATILCLPATAGADPGPAEGEMKKENLAIAKVRGDQVKIDEARLRTKLEDGREIKSFRVVRRGMNYTLLRVSQLEGRRLTEAIPLHLGDDGSSLAIRAPKIEGVKWITTCSAGSCGGFCVPAEDHCDCFGGDLGSSTTVVDAEQRDDGQVIELSSGASGDCTFGSRGGGIYDVLILH